MSLGRVRGQLVLEHRLGDKMERRVREGMRRMSIRMTFVLCVGFLFVGVRLPVLNYRVA